MLLSRDERERDGQVRILRFAVSASGALVLLAALADRDVVGDVGLPGVVIGRVRDHHVGAVLTEGAAGARRPLAQPRLELHQAAVPFPGPEQRAHRVVGGQPMIVQCGQHADQPAVAVPARRHHPMIEPALGPQPVHPLAQRHPSWRAASREDSVRQSRGPRARRSSSVNAPVAAPVINNRTAATVARSAAVVLVAIHRPRRDPR